MLDMLLCVCIFVQWHDWRLLHKTYLPPYSCHSRQASHALMAALCRKMDLEWFLSEASCQLTHGGNSGGGEEAIFFIGKAAIFFGQKMTSEPKEETLIFDPSWTRTSRPCQDKHCSNVPHLISPWFASLLLGDELPITADPMSKASEHSGPYFQKRTGWISQPPRRWKSQIRPK